jgi:hypothetical protein
MLQAIRLPTPSHGFPPAVAGSVPHLRRGLCFPPRQGFPALRTHRLRRRAMGRASGKARNMQAESCKEMSRLS